MAADLVRVSERIDASPETIFRCLVDPVRLGRWLDAEVTPAADEGAGLLIAFRGCDTVVNAVMSERVENQRLVLSWGVATGPDAARMPPGSTTVTIVLVPDARGTRVTITHEGLDAADVPDHDTGWREYLSALGALAVGTGQRVSARRPGP